MLANESGERETPMLVTYKEDAIVRSRDVITNVICILYRWSVQLLKGHYIEIYTVRLLGCRCC